MAVTDKVLQVGPTGVRRIDDAGVAEVGSGIVSTTGGLTIDADAASEIVVNSGALNTDFRVAGVGESSLLHVDASADRVGFGVAAPNTLIDMAGALSVRGIAAPAAAPAGQGRIYFDSGSNKFRFSENAGGYVDLHTGSGTAGHVAFWTGSSTLSGEGDLFWDATNNFLGIGNASPSTSLEVATGQVSVPAGLVSAPSVAFVGDLDTGLWSGGADDVRLAVGGADRIQAVAGGVTVTGATEVVTNGTGTTLEVRLNNVGAGADEKNWAFEFDSAVNTNALRINTNNDALSSSVNRLTIDRTGQVGIGGTTSPLAMLDVRGSAIFNEGGLNADFRVKGTSATHLLFADADANRVGINDSAPTAVLQLAVADAAVDGTKGVRVENTATSVVMEVGNAGDSYVGTVTAHDFALRSNNIPRLTALSTTEMVVNENGVDYNFRVAGENDPLLFVADADVDRIGIGDSSPAGKMEILSNTDVNLILTRTGVTGVNDIMELRTDVFSDLEEHLIKWTTSSGAIRQGRFGMVYDAGNNTVDFVWTDMFNTAETTAEAMRLKGNGNLGLGVSNPAVQLDMDGAFNVRGSAAPAVSPAGQGRMYFDSTSNTWKISENGGAYQDLLAAGGVGGSGTAGRVAFWTGTSTLASDSDFVWDSTNNRIGIAVGASPNTAIDMLGALSVRGVSAPAVSPAGEVRLYFDSGTNKTRISENGNPYQDLLGSGAVTGSGSINRLAFWNGATVLTSDAQLFWDNTNNYLGVDVAAPGSTLEVGGSVAGSVTTLAASTPLDDTHHTVLGNAGAGSITLTLPLASAAGNREYRVKKTDATSNTVTIARSGSDTIDGQTSRVLGSQYEAVIVQSDGTNWHLF